MPLVIGVGNGCEELLVAGRAADVLRRAAADRLDEPGIGGAGVWSGDALELYRVLPAVAEVVEVFERVLTPVSSSTSRSVDLAASCGASMPPPRPQSG